VVINAVARRLVLVSCNSHKRLRISLSQYALTGSLFDAATLAIREKKNLKVRITQPQVCELDSSHVCALCQLSPFAASNASLAVS
jgi:hypothetical protein